jgi:hypothetical protein
VTALGLWLKFSAIVRMSLLLGGIHHWGNPMTIWARNEVLKGAWVTDILQRQVDSLLWHGD